MAYYSTEIPEEELKNSVAKDWFQKFDSRKILGKVDFCISKGDKSFFWAEAKKGTNHEIEESFVQLILTIGREKTNSKNLPPKYIGAFDAEKIAFIEYGKVKDLFADKNIDWTVAPSDHNTKEFKLLYERIVDVLKSEKLQFDFLKEKNELKDFIKNIENAESYEIEVDENNIMFVFNDWCDVVKPVIDVNWENFKKGGLFDTEFFLADLLSYNNTTLEIYNNLKVILEQSCYKYKEKRDLFGEVKDFLTEINFKKDGKIAHNGFWNKYHRPPKEDFQKYILNRRDLLVPFDIRERQGAFYTPKKWVELSQKYLAEELGHDWQDKYYIWDCCAGTGNMLFGLRNPDRIFASTLEDEDVTVIHQNVKSGIAKLLEGNVFQFDFLNDGFEKLPEALQNIIKNEPEKLVIYINPPYAEATSARTPTGTGENKTGVAVEHLYNKKYKGIINGAANELYALFLFRIYNEIPGSIIANFSTLKHLQGSNFRDFRKQFQAKLKSLFIVPANSFDNVHGQFPIGFHIWDTKIKEPFKTIRADVYKNVGEGCEKVGKKLVRSLLDKKKSINEWWIEFKSEGDALALISNYPPDFQNQSKVCILSKPNKRYCINITENNFLIFFIYLSVRQCIPATWLNDRDQFLYPKDSWQTDYEFQNDCLAYSLFHRQNRISYTQGTNHFIPFPEIEVGAKYTYNSRFLIDYLAGKVQPAAQAQIFGSVKQQHPAPVVFSPEAQRVMDCAKDLYSYYHQEGKKAGGDYYNDAAFYDIKLYFQGMKNGRMRSTSDDQIYNGYLKALTEAQKILAEKIEKKVYEHGFLEI